MAFERLEYRYFVQRAVQVPLKHASSIVARGFSEFLAV